MTTQISGRRYLVEVYIDGPEYCLSKLWPPRELTSSPERHRTRHATDLNAGVSTRSSRKVKYSRKYDVMNAGTPEGRGRSVRKERQQRTDETEQSPPSTKRRKVILHVNGDSSSDRKYIDRPPISPEVAKADGNEVKMHHLIHNFHRGDSKSILKTETSKHRQMPSRAKVFHNRTEVFPGRRKSSPISPPISTQSTISTGESLPDTNVKSASQRLLHMATPLPAGGPSNSKTAKGSSLQNREDAFTPRNCILLKTPSTSTPNKEKLTIKIPAARSSNIRKQPSQMMDSTELHTPNSPLFGKRKSPLKFDDSQSPGLVDSSSTLGLTSQSTGRNVVATGVLDSNDDPSHIRQSPVVDPNTITDEPYERLDIISEAAIDTNASETLMDSDTSFNRSDLVKPPESDISGSGNLLLSSQNNFTEVAQDDVIASTSQHIQTAGDVTVLPSNKLVSFVEEGQRSSIAAVDTDTTKATSIYPNPSDDLFTISDTQAYHNPLSDETVSSMAEDFSYLTSSTNSEEVVPEQLIIQSHSTNSTQSTAITLPEIYKRLNYLSSDMQEPSLQLMTVDGDLNTPLTSRADTPNTATMVGVSPVGSYSDSVVKPIDSTQLQIINAIFASKSAPLGSSTAMTDNSHILEFSKLSTDALHKDPSCKVIKNDVAVPYDDCDSDEDLGELEYPDWDPETLASQTKVKYTLRWDLLSTS